MHHGLLILMLVGLFNLFAACSFLWFVNLEKPLLEAINTSVNFACSFF